MSNNAYLCCSPFERIYPSEAPDFDDRQHYVAMCRDAVPLVWLALFRVEDVRSDSAEEEEEGGADTAHAACPVAATEAALRRLHTAEADLERLFPASRLSQHAALLREAIEDWGFPYVTIELDEIAALHKDETEFVTEVGTLLRGLESPIEEARVLECIESVCGIPRGAVIPSPAIFLENRSSLSRKEEMLFVSALGTAYSHSVPWE